MSLKHLSGVHQQVLENRAEAERREKSECADDQNHGNEQAAEKRRGHRKGSGGFRHVFLLREIAGDGENRR